VTIDSRSPIPIYRQLADLLQTDIEQGRYNDGLPSEAALADTFGVGRMAVRRALDELLHEGLIVKQRGRPTRIRRQYDHAFLPLRPGDQFLARMPTHQERAQYDLGPGVPVIELRPIDGRIQVYPADRFGLQATDNS
jgi:DNA-binding GntR family transcriptional regulator